MGATPIYNLPYPDLGDPANPPIDLRELADAIETILSKQTPLPPAQVAYNSGDQIIVATAKTETPAKKRVTITNPSDRVPLLTRVLANGWYLLQAAGTNQTIYLETSVISGVCTTIMTTSTRRMFIGTLASNGLGQYEDFLNEKWVYIPPLGTVTFGLNGWKGNAGTATIRYTNVIAIPISFTGPSIPSYPDPTPPATA